MQIWLLVCLESRILGVGDFLYIFEGYESVHMGCLWLQMTDRAVEAFGVGYAILGFHHFFRILGEFSYIFHGNINAGILFIQRL